MDIIKKACPSCKKDIEFPSHFNTINCPFCGIILEIENSGGMFNLRLMREYIVTPVIVETYKGVFNLKLAKKEETIEKEGGKVSPPGQKDQEKKALPEKFSPPGRKAQEKKALEEESREESFRKISSKIEDFLERRKNVLPNRVTNELGPTDKIFSDEEDVQSKITKEIKSEISDVPDEDVTIALPVNKQKPARPGVTDEEDTQALPVTEPEPTSSSPSEDESALILPVDKTEPVSQAVPKEEDAQALPIAEPEEAQLKSNKQNTIIMIGLPVVVIFMLILFAIIHKSIKFPHIFNSATPSPVSTHLPTPRITEIPTESPIANLTSTPETVLSQTPLPQPTQMIVYVPTQYPTEIPTQVTVIYPTTAPVIPTRPSYKYTPVGNTGYVVYDTPVPTQVNYIALQRSYCDEVIRNKISPLYAERRYGEAIVECNNLINREKNYYINYLWMANCYLASKDTADAKYYIDMAWKLESNELGISYEQSESKKLYDLYYGLGGK